MVVIALDVPVDPMTLRRIAARGVYALARVGARFSHGSGDYAVAFSATVETPLIALTDSQVSLVFEATMDAVEEAVVDSLLAATSVVAAGGRTAHALPAAAVTGAGPVA
jgi:D-aminopeptidase